MAFRGVLFRINMGGTGYKGHLVNYSCFCIRLKGFEGTRAGCGAQNLESNRGLTACSRNSLASAFIYTKVFQEDNPYNT